MTSFNADVIIAGAGPSGSIAAYELASKGISVLILEKEIFPRYKVCGGGLTHKIINEIPFDISEVIESTIHSIRFSHDLKDVFLRSSQLPVMYCTMRDKLDVFLLRKATGAGAGIRFGEKCIKVEQDRSFVRIITNRGSYQSRLLIGADGASGIVARSADLRRNIIQGLAWEAEIEAVPAILEKYSQTVFLDWGTFPGGYGWIFPKKDHFSVGVGGPAVLSKWMKTYFERFIGSSGIIGVSNDQSDEVKKASVLLNSWPIPVKIKKDKFHNGLIMVTGDAGGLTDSLTGEGIYYAVRSGKLAANACIMYLQGQVKALEKYSESVNEELMTELLEANRLKNIFNAVPLWIHHLVNENDRVWGAFGKILRGERWYKDVKTGFGRYRFFWGLACTVSKWISLIKEKIFLRHGFDAQNS